MFSCCTELDMQNIMHTLNFTIQVYCDYHGHSRRKNVFLYGCSPQMSWMVDDTNNPTMGVNKVEDTSYKVSSVQWLDYIL